MQKMIYLETHINPYNIGAIVHCNTFTRLIEKNEDKSEFYTKLKSQLHVRVWSLLRQNRHSRT